ncbi:hypothetical protein SELMODRAFT_418187 [Selaginella moellendorffii]|uniref:RNA polymerase II C-terminal domain phosphatase-like n=1 Tax=Selaginella moellendorffii TaxID=88036 RepID=D8S4Y5_SELML|nr:RNA polymerase II C-terminal domain phosphatase-like 4 [Selaginella moellendorffii]EFJ20507.1 hypothetical protein SELMODRAFT_418187 [Selaginella moellendorffii]|eukprot:XP_002978521.1 RNA polymerase II C-terminal domain phosphatase-like 4 [Selaginella moellendorffii]
MASRKRGRSEFEGGEEEEDFDAQLRKEYTQKVLQQQKLILVLDLDHTLLNSASFSKVDEEERLYLEKIYDWQEKAPKRRKLLHKVESLQVWTKIRPFAFKFLEEASKFFDLHIYTNGREIYAETMAKLLDPTGSLFKGHIFSRDHNCMKAMKDLDTVPGDESITLIVDDSDCVWPKKHHKNLIPVYDRYLFFRSSTGLFGLRESSSLTSKKKDEVATKATLAKLLEGLKRIHSEFFQESGCFAGDVRQTMREVKGHALSGCKIVICAKSQAAHELLWDSCQELGAECVVDIDDTVTHVVVASKQQPQGLELSAQAGKYLVWPSWIHTAHYRCCRPDEAAFLWRKLE